ncbi:MULTISPECIES: class I SAM-dependent methyltransferase [Enterococcus]|uniref:class I SAM-dependent methyltransferase n=1 Tax=Enterococcus TaxID=1350 RepID=UPI00065E536D|nr:MULTISPECIES: class I SAM-dependent methyltransferase [Enterococcus]
MFPEKIEKSFELTLEAIQLLQNALESSFLDAYIENAENMIDHFQVRVIDGVPNAETVKKVEAIYQQLQEIPLEAEEIRKLAQLLLLKGGKFEQLQPNHQLTPDGIGFLFVYLLEQLYPKKGDLTVLDISVGMGNLLLTVLLNLQNAGYRMKGYGVDIDETLLAVAAATSDWTHGEVQLFHQDGLQELLIDPMDAVISDLPVGYYPHDEKAEKFLTAAKENHSFAHHLLMEQAMNYVKENSFGFFLVPSNFLETEQSQALKQLFIEKVYLQAIIQLPDELFKNEVSRKSIIILQQKGEHAKQAEVLVAKLATLKDSAKVAEFFKEFEAWKTANL